MERCWNVTPEFRPSFENIRQRMQSFLKDEVCDQGLKNVLVSFTFVVVADRKVAHKPQRISFE